MKKIDSCLREYLKNIEGNLLGIGIKNIDIVKEIDKNEKITVCNLLNSIDLDFEDNGKRKRIKKISIKKIRKIFKRKKVNYIIANGEELKNFFKTFVRDSIYINSNTIYLYLDKNYDDERLIYMYNRYNVKIEITKCSDGKILIIDTRNSIDHKWKNKLYYLSDTLFNLFDIIGDFLIKY